MRSVEQELTFSEDISYIKAVKSYITNTWLILCARMIIAKNL